MAVTREEKAAAAAGEVCPGTRKACTRPYSLASVDAPRSREGDTRPAGRPYPPPVGELPGVLKSTTSRTTCAAQTPPRAS